MVEGTFCRAGDPLEACELLSRYGGTAQILAGGTDLMAKVNRRLVHPEVIIDIGGSGLDYIRINDDNVVIGATTPFVRIMGSSLVRENAPLLAEAAGNMGSPAIRNVGTLGGNLANASPAADSATALLASGARLRLLSKNGAREVDIERFFVAPGKTILRQDELLLEVIIPCRQPTERWGYCKLGRRQAYTLSLVSVAISLQIKNSSYSRVRIALGAVAPVPMLAVRAGLLMEGKRLEHELIEHVATVAAEETDPIDDVRATAWYRRRACGALVRRLLTGLAGEEEGDRDGHA